MSNACSVSRNSMWYVLIFRRSRMWTTQPESRPSISKRIHFFTSSSAFKARTGCGVLVNTSFNVRGEPIVCTPEDAFRCFMGTDIDLLVCGNAVLEKSNQYHSSIKNYTNQYELD